MKFLAGQFDVAVIGAGHAGIEAALAAAQPQVFAVFAALQAQPASQAAATLTTSSAQVLSQLQPVFQLVK